MFGRKGEHTMQLAEFIAALGTIAAVALVVVVTRTGRSSPIGLNLPPRAPVVAQAEQRDAA
jgi:hypothetical protein